MDLPISPELGPNFSYKLALGQLDNALNDITDTPNGKQIAEAVVQLGALLLKKNKAYGDAALAPMEVFAKDLPVSTRLGIRMDDKISRMARGQADGEDPQLDLAGYLILLRIAKANEIPPPPSARPAPVIDVTAPAASATPLTTGAVASA